MARNFPDYIDAFMEYTKNVEAPDKFLRWSALSTVAAALERKVWVSNGAATWYPNLYVMLIGDAGSRKSTSSEIAVDLLREVSGIEFLADRLNDASLTIKLRSIGNKKNFIYQGVEYKHSAIFLYASEAANAFSEMYSGGGIVIMLTDLFNCGPRGWHDKHAWVKHTIKDGEIKVFNPCINVLGCSTGAWFTTKIMSKLDAEAGFGSRMLLVVHKGQYRKNFEWQQEDNRKLEMRAMLIEDLRAINQLEGQYEVDFSFQEAFSKYDEQHTAWLAERQANSLVTGYQERKLTHAMKVSQVIAASRRDKLIITGEDLRDAWKLLSSLEGEMLEAFATISAKPEKRTYNDVWEYIQRKKLAKVGKHELVAAFQDRYTVKEVSNAIKDLQDAGRLKFLPTEFQNGLRYEVVNQGTQLRLLP